MLATPLNLFLDSVQCVFKRRQTNEWENWVPFGDVFNVKEDNGEWFLSEYYEGQQQRDQQRNQDDKFERCPCLDCARNLDPLPHRKKMGDEVQDAAIGLGDDDDDGVWGDGGWDWTDGNDDLLTI